MSDADWDADDFEPQAAAGAAKTTDKWEGEDSDEDVKDNWDDEEEENGNDESKAGAVQVKKKKSLKDRIAEKEAKRKKELEEKKMMEEAERKKLTPEELAEEKLRQQKLQEDADFELAKEIIGESDDTVQDSIDRMNPRSKDDFNKLGELLRNKFTKCETSAHYVPFLEALLRDVSVSLDSDDIKKLASTLNAVANEKAKQQKGTKGKKKAKSKANLNAGKNTSDYGDYQVEAMDEFDDFI